jgi:hypothetical protein
MNHTLKYKVFFHFVSSKDLGCQYVAQVIGDIDDATTKEPVSLILFTRGLRGIRGD